MSFLPVSLQAGLTALRQLPVDHPDFYAWYTLILRFLFPILAILMLVRIIRSLVKASPKPEVWAYLSLPNGATEPLTHWENILGRSPASDVVLNYPVVSRQHAALIRTGEDRWTVHDLGSKSGTLLNGRPVDPAGSSMTLGDVLSLGGVDTVLLPVSDEETARRKKSSGEGHGRQKRLVQRSAAGPFYAPAFFKNCGNIKLREGVTKRLRGRFAALNLFKSEDTSARKSAPCRLHFPSAEEAESKSEFDRCPSSGI